MTRRFLLDNDGSNLFYHLSDEVERDVCETVEECPANVTTYLLCSGAGTFYFPTRVGTVVPNAAPLLKAHAAGKDPFGMLIGELRASGKETFVSFRMNDVHNPDAPDQWNLPTVRREHPDCVVNGAAVRSGKADWLDYCLDYSRREVREYALAVIAELAERYQFDGLQLDWMRFPRHLSGTPDEVWARRDALTEFTADVRAILTKVRARMAARIPTSLAGCRFLGTDIAEWTGRGLVDFLVASPFLTTDFAPPLQELRAAMSGRPIPLYAGFDFNHATQNHCPESLRATCASLYEAGADGIYLFNFPCWTEYLGARPYQWFAGLDDPVAACRKPLLFSVSHRTHRIPNVDLPGQLPLNVRRGAAESVTLPIPRTALPARRALLLVHASGDVAVSVNGVPCAARLNDRSELFLEHGGSTQGTRNGQGAVRSMVLRLDARAIRAGENTLTLQNRADSEAEIARVNLGLW